MIINGAMEKRIDTICVLPFGNGWARFAQRLGISGCLVMAVTVFLVLSSPCACAANADAFSMLQVGENTYKDVRVTTKARSYIIIVHSGGMISIKVSELPDQIRQRLGYDATPGSKISKAASAVEAALAKKVQTKRFVATVALLIGYLFFSYCCLLICQKTGNQPGLLVVVPVLQAFPMLRAASMSAWWFIALFIPGLNLWAYARWCAKIVRARNKTFPLTVLLLFPPTSWLAFIFLAFAEASPPEPKERYPEIMTLETA
jgi:hypothetical protein